MNTGLIGLLTAKKILLKQELEAVLERGADARSLRELERALQSIDALEKLNSAPPQTPWIVPVFVLAISISVIGLAATIHINQPQMQVDVRTRSFALTVARKGSGLVSDKHIRVRSVYVVGDGNAEKVLARANSISAIKFLPGAAAILEQAKDCLNVQLLPPTIAAAGVVITAVMGTASMGTLPSVEKVTLQGGTHFSICGEFEPDFFLVGAVEKLELSRTLTREVIDGKIHIASIQSGTLRIPVVSKSIELKDTDQLFLTDIAKGWVFVKLVPEMRVSFAGDVGMARSVDLVKDRPGDGAGLVPTLLEWATKSSFIAGMFGILTGLIGMIWSSIKYFGYRSP
ncbi:hypothetical protein NHH73_26380 [Oxalobacteraceae bacterium OTU3CINTB1]|nr:hypothetical protein NHH73_26380 [Oxalobacteraceae bacterium OTU3CINTB1]